jgi:hypothetical protein
MANTDFKKMVLRNLEFKYPRLNTTYRYNTAEKRSEECAPTAQGATYSISWEMGKYEAKKLHDELKAHYETCKTKGPFSKVFGMKKLENGNYEFKAKKNGVNREGNVNKKPEVVDGMKQPLADLKFFSGSKGNIIFTAYPSSNPQTSPPEYGITLMIEKVQVTHAVYGGGGLDDFDEVTTTISGVIDLSPDDFGPATAQPASPAQEMADALGDDEIPF